MTGTVLSGTVAVNDVRDQGHNILTHNIQTSEISTKKLYQISEVSSIRNIKIIK
jgi:hypothetical protein